VPPKVNKKIRRSAREAKYLEYKYSHLNFFIESDTLPELLTAADLRKTYSMNLEVKGRLLTESPVKNN
jgi:hypothetical protein